MFEPVVLSWWHHCGSCRKFKRRDWIEGSRPLGLSLGFQAAFFYPSLFFPVHLRVHSPSHIPATVNPNSPAMMDYILLNCELNKLFLSHFSLGIWSQHWEFGNTGEARRADGVLSTPDHCFIGQLFSLYSQRICSKLSNLLLIFYVSFQKRKKKKADTTLGDKLFIYRKWCLLS